MLTRARKNTKRQTLFPTSLPNQVCFLSKICNWMIFSVTLHKIAGTSAAHIHNNI